MDIVYPSTKFYIPRPRRNVVRRQRLFSRLSEGVDCKLIAVCAPAGYGKTTLVASWLAGVELPVAWVSADEADNNIYRFCVCLLDSLREKNLLAGDRLRQVLQSGAPPSPESLATLFLDEIATIQDECILVIDDYHVLASPAVHSLTRQIIEQSVPQLHFLICSRTQIPFSVSKMRAQSELFEVGQQELSLSLEETALYMNMVMGVGLKPADVTILHEHTEGWLVGLQLAALSIREQQNPAGFIQNLKGDNRYIADYLVDEVLAHIPAELQDFLLRTSVLKEMNAALCNSVLQVEYSQDMLEELDRKRLFIIPLDEIRQSFRYHHLFRDMLFDRLCRKSPELLRNLYQRASAWYSQAGQKETAVEYALAAGDEQAVVTLLGEIGPEVLYRGNWDQLLGWYDKLSEPVFLDVPQLWLNYLMTLINVGAITRASQKLAIMEAEDLTAKGLAPEDAKRIQANLAAGRGVMHLHSRADPVAAKKSLAIAREMLPHDVNIDLVFAEFNYGAACLMAGEFQEGRGAVERSVEWAKQTNVTLGALIGMGYLAEAATMSGDLPRANDMFQSAFRYAYERGLQEGAVFAKANLGLGRLCYEWNDLDQAGQYLARGVSLAEHGGYLDQLLTGYVDLMRVQFLQGQMEDMQHSLDGLRRIVEKYGDPPAALAYYEAARAAFAIQRGDLGVASRWASQYQQAADGQNTRFSEFQQALLVRVLGLRDNSMKLCPMLQPMRDWAASDGRLAAMISYDVMAAKCLFMNGEPERALEMLDHVLGLAEPGQFVRTFLDEGGVVISMVKQLLAARTGANKNDGASAEYLQHLLNEASKETAKRRPSQAEPGSVTGLASLTSQELKVLQLLEAGYTNKQISIELSISLNTVKYHLKNIFGKIGVTNRTQASKALRENN